MKSIATTKNASPSTIVKQLRPICLEALEACENASQKCLAAGQALNEAKEICNGDFMDLVAKELPEVTHRTATTWMRAAANIAKALPPVPDSIDIEASAILTLPDAELSDEAREWKQQWFDFTADKTIKECLNGVFVEGDEAHRVDRAVNGKTKGGAGGDRKDFPLFVAVKLKDMGVHFSHWSGMNTTQKAEALNALKSAITGEPINLRKRNFNFTPWPDEVCELALEALKARMKGAK